MSSKTSSHEQDKSNAHFFRALRYLWPYRKLMAISILCAFFVSGAFAGGLGTLLPVMHVFFDNDTIEQFVDRQVAQYRLGVGFADRTDVLEVIRVDANGPGASIGLAKEDKIALPGKNVLETVKTLSDPALQSTSLQVNGQPGAQPLTLHKPWFYMNIGRKLAAYAPLDPIYAIASVLGLIATVSVISNVVSFFQEYLSDKAAVLAVNDIRRRLYDHVLHVPLSHFGMKGTSDVTSRLTQDAQNLNEGFKSVLGQAIQEPIKMAAAFGLALFTSWKLTAIIVCAAPIMIFVIRKFGKKMRRTSRRAMLSSAVMLGQIEGSLLGIRVVKGASAERFERRRYGRIMWKLVDQQLRMSRIDAFTEPTMGTLMLFVVGGLILVASCMVLRWHTLQKEQFFLVMICLSSIGDSFRRVSKVNNVLQRSNAAAARIFEVLDLPIERTRRAQLAPVLEDPTQVAEAPAKRVKLPLLSKEITFEDVTFSYPNSPTPALRNVSLTIPRGKCVAIVGRNGSGKTTLLALLPRFYDPQGGRILIDGIDTRDATLRSLRSQISIVTQDSVIFPGTIAQNIAYGHPLSAGLDPMPPALMDRVVTAARQAYADEFIMEKPQGYETMLGELGGQLSGGQKQRLCIARAIFRTTPILVLDEATSQVDSESEELIQRALEGLIHERTTFVIAHRLATIKSADEIIVMERGQIVGQGRHDELMATCETYQQLIERQLFALPV